MSPVQRLLSLLLLVSIAASSVEVVFGDASLAASSLAEAVSVGSSETPAGAERPTTPGQPSGDTTDCACLCACVCTGANSALVPAVVFAQFQVLGSELPPRDLRRVHPLEAPRPPFRPPVA